MSEVLFNVSIIVLAVCTTVLLVFFFIFIKDSVKWPHSRDSHFSASGKAAVGSKPVKHQHA